MKLLNTIIFFSLVLVIIQCIMSSLTIEKLKDIITDCAENQEQAIKDGIQSYKMYEANEMIKNSKSEFGIDGLYFPEYDFFCIRAKSNITESQEHEQCHSLIRNDYEHFYKGD